MARERYRGNVSLTRYLEAFRTSKGIFAAGLLATLIGVSFLAPFIFPRGYLQSPAAKIPFDVRNATRYRVKLTLPLYRSRATCGS